MSEISLAELFTLAREVATALGDGWSPLPNEPGYGYWPQIAGPDGATVFLRREGAKVEVHADYPGNDAYDVKHLTIGVSVSRGAATIAREIQRRLLPEYLPELARVQAHIADRGRMRAARMALAEELAAPIGARVVNDDRLNDTHVGGYPVKFEIDYRADAGTVTIHGASPDVMRAIVAVLASRVNAS